MTGMKIYTLTAYVLDYDTENGVYCEKAAFTTYYASADDVENGYNDVWSLSVCTMRDTSPFTSAVIGEMIRGDKGVHINTIETRTICVDNVEKLGKKHHDVFLNGEEGWT